MGAGERLLSRMGSNVGLEDVLVGEEPTTMGARVDVVSRVHVLMHPDIVPRCIDLHGEKRTINSIHRTVKQQVRF